MSSDLETRIARCADLIYEARQARRAIAPVRAMLPEMDLAAAYRVQQINVRRTAEAGGRIVGRKIGLTSEAVQRQLGVDQPDFGVLFEAMRYDGPAPEMSVSSLISPRIEAEFAFRLGADIVDRPVTPDSAAQAIEAVCAAFEIVDSATNWDINIVDTIADNASSGGFVTGAWVPYARDLDLPSRAMRLTHGGEEISVGRGSATLGDPLNALVWLADTAIGLGEPLRAGDVVLAGALGPMKPMKPGDYMVEIDGFEPLHLRARA